MPRTKLLPGLDIQPRLPADWGTATDVEKARVQTDLHEILTGLKCVCNGTRLAVDSVATTVQSRIRSLALTRSVDAGIKELAGERGVDIAVASTAKITAAVSGEEINSLIALANIMPQDTVESLVANDEMGRIETEELGKTRLVHDPDWKKDLAQLVARSVPHTINGLLPSGLYAAQTISIKLETLKIEVDNDGSVCAWTYEHSARGLE